MSINLLEEVQKKLQYPALQKIDPNTQEVVVDNKTPDEHRFSQAAIPAILTGLNQYSTNDAGAENILRGDMSTNWASEIFGDKLSEVVQKISDYSFHSQNDSLQRINNIANTAIGFVRDNVKPAGTMMEVKNFMSAQTKDTLTYLPAALQMSKTLNDTTLDDNTHKMEGPISSLMNKLGAAFSSPPSDKELNEKQ